MVNKNALLPNSIEASYYEMELLPYNSWGKMLSPPFS